LSSSGKLISLVYTLDMNLTSVYKKYAGKWVALKANSQTVVTHATNAQSLYKKMQKLDKTDAVILKIPKKVIAFVG
jgi:hypothetical protein